MMWNGLKFSGCLITFVQLRDNQNLCFLRLQRAWISLFGFRKQMCLNLPRNMAAWFPGMPSVCAWRAENRSFPYSADSYHPPSTLHQNTRYEILHTGDWVWEEGIERPVLSHKWTRTSGINTRVSKFFQCLHTQIHTFLILLIQMKWYFPTPICL